MDSRKIAEGGSQLSVSTWNVKNCVAGVRKKPEIKTMMMP